MLLKAHRWGGILIVTAAAKVAVALDARMTHMNPDKNAADRRSSDRFSIEREVRYKVLNKKSGEELGAGKTVNMSSNGVLFTTEQLLLPGRRVEVSISWPAQLNNKCALRLVARGRVVRFDDGQAAMEIQQYEFKTQALAAVIPIQ
jgi:hypothetical protein